MSAIAVSPELKAEMLAAADAVGARVVTSRVSWWREATGFGGPLHVPGVVQSLRCGPCVELWVVPDHEQEENWKVI